MARSMLQAEGPGDAPPFDGAGPDDAHEFALGEPVCHRDQVAGGAAADIQHAAARGRRRFQTEDGCEGRQMVRVRLRLRVSGIADGVVRVRHVLQCNRGGT
jgi:hypothetical protein